jgi:putative ABC transport system substrate-binding protein
MEGSVAAEVSRIGYVGVDDVGPYSVAEAFRQGLRDQGCVDGINVQVEYRFSRGRAESYPRLLGEVLALRPAVLVIADSEALPIAKGLSGDVPIVMTVSGDPVRDGFVASLERPGGNITGMTNQARALNDARLGWLQRLAPASRRLAVLWNVSHPGVEDAWERTREAAAARGLEAVSCGIREADELPAAVGAARAAGADALLVLQDRLTTGARHQIVALAAEHALPGVYG